MSRAEQAAAEAMEALQRERAQALVVWERAFVALRTAFLGRAKRPMQRLATDAMSYDEAMSAYAARVAGMEREAAMRATVAVLRECYPEWHAEAAHAVAEWSRETGGEA